MVSYKEMESKQEIPPNTPEKLDESKSEVSDRSEYSEQDTF